MEEHKVKITDIKQVTHDVKRYRVEKPAGYSFLPGQATEVCINKPEWAHESRPFTFTSLNDWDFLEFTIKSYRDHDGVTNALDKLVPGDELIIHDVWGAIHYEEAGLFIAGGAGVTPFIAIMRSLHSKNMIDENRLLFANKTTKDIILKDEFEKILGDNFINILSDEKVNGYAHGFITEEFLKKQIKSENDYIYLCGPPTMMDNVQAMLDKMGVGKNKLIIEL
ncbi:MAG: flavodoxin reductase [Bacteroidetes bacterium]|nr:MAG: flavodoxin reductase [Bacteroidota bacterium]